jgi:hypothetical protein
MKSRLPSKLILAATAVVLISLGAKAMAGIFGNKTLFSQLNGTVLMGGKPCADAQILQTVSDGGGEEISAQTSSDDNGKFSLPAITKSKGFLSLLPGEFVAAQQILILYEGKEYQGWISTKRSPEPNSEAQGANFELVCDLDREADYGPDYFGICSLVNAPNGN